MFESLGHLPYFHYTDKQQKCICQYIAFKCYHLLTWKKAMEKKGLRVNAGKTEIMKCGAGMDLLQSSGTVCRTGVGSNSIFCKSRKHWVHKKCSGLKHLTKDHDYRCTWCQGTACSLGWQTTEGSPSRT